MDDANTETDMAAYMELPYTIAAPYLSDHPWIHEFLLENRGKQERELVELIEGLISEHSPPRSTDLRILLNAMEKARTERPHPNTNRI